ncbi:MAG: hypothetical protein K6G55_08695 [Selenomonadaceae bacterium]|nr:hypothetical protein [Selenomonadaceae bacterium]
MEKSFDCWCDFSDELAQTNETISKFFRDRVSIGSRNDKTVNKHVKGKIITYFDEADFFGDCLKSHGKGLSLGKTIMLYAFLVYVLNRNSISDADFRRRIRIVNNLVINSGNAELSNSEARNNGNRIPAMLEQVDNIIIDEKILNNDEIKTRNKYNFNENQLQEEREKLQWTKINQDRAEELFELEDHYLLYGQISIVGLEHPEYFKRFISLFDCDYDKINCALLALGDYRQTDKYGQIYQLGARKPVAWQNLFHKTLTNRRFDDTKNILEKLLTTACIFTDNHLQKIINDYLGDCESKSEFQWMYYYIKYEDFRPQDCYGRYRWECFTEKPYSFLSLSAERRRSTRSYQPFLKAAKTKGTLSVDDFGMRLIFEKYYVEATNFGYVCKDIDTNKKIDELSISQQNGIDTEDRIKAFETFIKSLPY